MDIINGILFIDKIPKDRVGEKVSLNNYMSESRSSGFRSDEGADYYENLILERAGL